MKAVLQKIIILILIISILLSGVLPTAALRAESTITVYQYDENESDWDQDFVVLQEITLPLTEDSRFDYSYQFTIDGNTAEPGRYFLLSSEDGKVYHQNNSYEINMNKMQVGTTPKETNMDFNGKKVTIKKADGTIEEIELDTEAITGYDFDYMSYNVNNPVLFTGNDKSTEGQLFAQLEEMVAAMVNGTANLLIKLINLAVGGSQGSITMDDVIFNHYPPTRLLYFDAAARNETRVALDNNGNPKLDEEGKEIREAVNPLIRDISEGIEKWSQVFTGIATTGYLAILLYMGIQILLSSTANRRAEYKRYLIDWLMGLAIMFFSPLLVKYAIEMNDDFVASIEKQKVVAAQKANYSSELTSAVPQFGGISKDSKEEALESWANELDSNPFSSENTNYMARMANKANTAKKLSYAIAYMIMAWQFLILVVTYYRRLFMVGFLLVIFPLVALSYAVDKVKDGKSQAFDRWAKEILINIFIQTFHAIIYVFAINASFVGGEEGDWILMIIGVSFLFRGEDIIKGIFGQKSDTAATLASSAVMTLATYRAVQARCW